MTKPKRATRRPPSAKPKSKGGRPPKYQALFARQAERLVKDGATDAELANFFEVNFVTIWRWKDAHPEFCKALQRSKDIADDLVERSLFQRATGYSHDAVKILQRIDEPPSRCWAWPKGYLVLAAFLGVVAGILPSSKTVYLIAASEAGERIATGPEGREMLDLIRGRIRDALSSKG